MCMSRGQLIVEQKRDQTLAPLFDAVVSDEEIEKMSSGSFLKDDVLVRKWTLPHASLEHGDTSCNPVNLST